MEHQRSLIGMLCGGFMLLFGLAGVIFGAMSVAQSFKGYDAPKQASAFINGKAVSQFEGQFDENMAHYPLSVKIWNAISFLGFKEASKGAVIGDEGWLFTDEEFEIPANFNKNLSANLTYIDNVNYALSDKGINLIITPVPSKARVMYDKLGRYQVPQPRVMLYNKFISYLKGSDIAHYDVLPVIMSKDGYREQFFLKTDTHWSPSGAGILARRAGDFMKARFARTMNWDEYQSAFNISLEPAKPHEGDLMRYTVSGDMAQKFGLETDKLSKPTATKAGDAGLDDLFSDAYIPVTLVGTSYSANPLWGYEAQLKRSLSVDILNMADEGLGPFETMKNYLESDTYKNADAASLPKLIIWEIPERYLPVAYDLD